jgi:hypothetical protein
MKNLHLFSLVLGVSAVLYACKDKTEDPPANNGNNNNGKTKQQMLTEKNWKITSLMSGSTDIWALLVSACNKDDEYHFRKDDSLAQYAKSQKCNSGDPDSTVSMYKLYNNNTQLILKMKLTSSITLDDTADITELTESSLKVNAEYSGLPAAISFTRP